MSGPPQKSHALDALSPSCGDEGQTSTTRPRGVDQFSIFPIHNHAQHSVRWQVHVLLPALAALCPCPKIQNTHSPHPHPHTNPLTAPSRGDTRDMPTYTHARRLSYLLSSTKEVPHERDADELPFKDKPKKPCRKPSVSSIHQYAVVDRQAAVRDRPLCTTTTCRVPPSTNLQRSTAPARSQVAGPVCTPPSTCFTSVYRSMGGKRGAH